MPYDAVIADFQTLDVLKGQMPDILAAPKDLGRLEMIVARGPNGSRTAPHSAMISLARGMDGDHWAGGTWMTTEGGAPHPDIQICIMNARCIRAIAGDKQYWPPAGDNLFLDLDLTPENAPAGTRFEIGSALLEITKVPHNGCQSFIDRYGRDACLFVNTGQGKDLRLRGIYGRVVRDGVVTCGDTVRKLG